MFTQNGIARILIIIYGSLGVLFLISAVTYTALHTMGGAGNESTTQNLQFLAPQSTFIPTNSPSLETTKPASNNQPIITHDGSRTGPIIDYTTFCDGKIIKVYENEIVPFTLPNGQVVYSTIGDHDCFLQKLSQQQNLNNTSQSSNYSFVQDCNKVAYETSDVCVNTCGMVAKNDNVSCNNVSYSDLDQCLRNSTSKMESCISNCQNIYHDSLIRCGN